MKKTISILLCIVLLACFAACDAEDTRKESDSAIAVPSIVADDVIVSESDAKPEIPTNDAVESETEEKPAIIANNVTDSEDMMEVDCPVGTLHYPKKWKDDIAFQVNDDQLVALYYDIPLFTLYFGGEKGYLFGTLEFDGAEIDLRYEMHDLDSTNENYETMSVMQEDINIIFQYLMEEGKLTVSD